MKVEEHPKDAGTFVIVLGEHWATRSMNGKVSSGANARDFAYCAVGLVHQLTTAHRGVRVLTDKTQPFVLV
jgi:hypothetical protein